MKLGLLVQRLCILALLVVLQANVRGQAGSEQISSITSALRTGEFDKALDLLQSSLRDSPNNPQLWMFQGLAFSGKRDPKSALNS
jgi:Flp pilus assembly protein TadD